MFTVDNNFYLLHVRADVRFGDHIAYGCRVVKANPKTIWVQYFRRSGGRYSSWVPTIIKRHLFKNDQVRRIYLVDEE